MSGCERRARGESLQCFWRFSSSPLAAGQGVFGIHHPDGKFQRYSSGTYLGLSRVTNSATNVTFAELFKSVSYTQGIVEGGSSGSPLLVKPGTVVEARGVNTFAYLIELGFHLR